MLRVLWAASFAALAVYVAHVRIGLPPKGVEVDWRLLLPVAYVLTAAICFTRVLAVPRERLIWSMFGVGMLTSSTGWAYHYLVLQHDASPPYPSLRDAFELSSYALSFVALTLLLRTRLRRFSAQIWLDAVTGALALAALSAAVLLRPIVARTGGDVDAIATSLEYPMLDILGLALVFGMFALSGWRPERRWVLLGLAWSVQIVADTLYLDGVANGTYTTGGALDALWLASNLLVAYAAWQRSGRPSLRFEGRAALAVPLIFTGIALSVLVYGNFDRLDPVAVALAMLALVASLVSTVRTYFEQRRLEALVNRDPLTGLYNYREFHQRLDEQLATAGGEHQDHKLAVVLMDVDGFKDVNDLRGHAEGDRVLRDVARAIAYGKRGSDTAARLGGDEFGVLMPNTDAEGATALARRMGERVDRLGEGVGISYGVAEWPADGPAKELLLLRADVAMYAAKSGATEPPAGSRAAEDRRRGDHVDASDAQSRGRAPADDPELERDKAQLRAYAEAVRVTYAQGLERAQQLKENYLATVLTLASAVEAKDEYTGGHINRVHHLGLLLARELVPEETDDPQMAYGFLLHDIGKLAVPDEILNKSGPLTDEEWVLMRGHPEAGVRILAPIPFLGGAIDVVRHHHERWDGCGYPAGLAGEGIPMWSRIFAVVDSVDAMTSDRPYRAALSLEVAHEELEKGAGTQFDPVCVAAFMRLDRGQVESLIQTSSTARTLRAGAEPATALASANRPPVAAE